MKGRSNRAIRAATNLTPGQITYRLRTFDVSRMDYRNGVGTFAKAFDQATADIAEKVLRRHLAKLFGNQAR